MQTCSMCVSNCTNSLQLSACIWRCRWGTKAPPPTQSISMSIGHTPPSGSWRSPRPPTSCEARHTQSGYRSSRSCSRSHSFACLHVLLTSLASGLVHNTTMFHSHEEFLWRYSRQEDRGDGSGGHTLGHGGASTGVER